MTTEANKTKHTATPWKWADDWSKLEYNPDSGNATEKYLDLSLRGANDEPVLPLRIDHYCVEIDAQLTGLSDADRDFIVRAVNAHESLVDALQLTVERFEWFANREVAESHKTFVLVSLREAKSALQSLGK